MIRKLGFNNMPIVKKVRASEQKSYRQWYRFIDKFSILIRHMSLEDLLKLSAYVTAMYHGGSEQLPEGMLPKWYAGKINKNKSHRDLRIVIYLINKEIVKKNRETVNQKVAQKVYDDFWGTD